MIDELGKGALPDPKDERDYEAPMGAVSVDWTKEFRLPEPPTFDQKSSDCCVSCAWSYYHWQLTGKFFSKRDLFCRIFLDYGAYIRDGGLQIVKNGQADSKEVKDPASPTAANMRSSLGTSDEYRTDDKQINSFTLSQQDIDGLAWGIQNYKGVVFGVNGDNQGWKDMKYPQPPSLGVTPWGHALYAMGFHRCTDGQKCIIAKSSWSGTNEHHIRENYFLTGNTFSAWTLIPKKEQETMKLIKDNGTVYLQAGVNNKVKLGIADQATLALFGDEPVIDGIAEGNEYTISNGFIIHKK